MRSRPRVRAALVLGALLSTAVPLAVPLLASGATHLTCGVTQTGRWERIPVRSFQPVSGISASTSDTVTAYGLDRGAAQDVAATNGYTVQVSHTHGCAWSKGVDLSATPTGAQPFLGTQSKIVTVGVLGRTVLAAVAEGSGGASRPHVLRSTQGGAEGSWTTVDNGLPSQGAPRLLRTAGDGRTAYLTISPTASGGTDDGGSSGVIPPLPGGGGTGSTPTGFLYRTTDGGASWTLQTGATDLPGGGTGFTALDIDAGNVDTIYGIAGGRLLVSHDAGGSFTAGPGSGYTAVAAGAAQQVIAFNSSGAQVSYNGGSSYNNLPAPGGVVGAATRGGESFVLVQVGSNLSLFDPRDGSLARVPPPLTPRGTSLIGDRGSQPSYHALAGHSLLRYVDVPPKGALYVPPPVGDNTVPPPNPGTVSPRVANVAIPVGQSSQVDFTLDLPKNPTPLDLFFLIDVSTGMDDVLDDIKANAKQIVRDLTAAKVDVQVGLGSIGTGPLKGENDYPAAYAFPPENRNGQVYVKPYVKPRLYQALSYIRKPDAEFYKTLSDLKIETVPPGYSNSEGQLMALKNVANGFGTQSENDVRLGLPTRSAVLPGQDGHWRSQPDVRRIVVLATNEPMQVPYGAGSSPFRGLSMGSDELPGSSRYDPRTDLAPTIKMLRAARIGVVGLTGGIAEAQPQLQKIAVGTGMVAPPGGINCGGDGFQQLSPGDGLVCNNGEGFSAVISRLLSSLVDRQNLKALPHTRTPVLGAITDPTFTSVNVKQANVLPFQVNVSCVDVKPGTYQQDVDLTLRGSIVGRARVNVTCLKEQAVVRPRPLAFTPPNPPVNPAPQPPPPPPPPPPAVQPNPQPQVQTQVQVNPMSAGAMQEQQELQLALAMNGTFKDDDPAFSAGTEMAMVDRRKRESVQAMGVLAIAITACSAFGLAGLRAKPDLRVRRATVR